MQATHQMHGIVNQPQLHQHFAKGNSIQTIGVVVPDMEDAFTKEVIEGIKLFFADSGHRILIGQSSNRSEDEKRRVESFFKMQVDGLIVWLADDTDARTGLGHFSKNNIPVLFFNRVVDPGVGQHILLDYSSTCCDAVKHLVAHSCRRIVLAVDYCNQHVGLEHFRGYQKALKDAHLVLEEALVWSATGRTNGTQIADRIVSSPASFDAIIFSDSVEAIMCMLRLKEKGINIPQDIALVSLSDHLLSTQVKPPLSVIRFNGVEAGKQAAQMLISGLPSNRKKEWDQKVTQGYRLVIRGSSLKLQ